MDYTVIAAKQDYRGSDDFGKVVTFIETFYARGRPQLPFKSILIIGD